jgi:hypothetical protein
MAIEGMKELLVLWLNWHMWMCLTDVVCILDVLDIGLWFFTWTALVLLENAAFVLEICLALDGDFLGTEFGNDDLVLLAFLLDEGLQCLILIFN